MEFLTGLAVKLMPVVQDPFFKTGCYGISVIAMIILAFILARHVIRKPSEKNEKVIVERKNPGLTAFSIIFFISLSAGVLADITEWNEPGKISVFEDGEVITKPKPYISLGSKTPAVYDKTRTVASPRESEKIIPVEFTFRDQGTASAGYKFDIVLPEEPEMIRRIHNEYGSQKNLVEKAARPLIKNAIKNGAMLLLSEDCPEVKEKKLTEFVNDQLSHGLYHLEQGLIAKDREGNPVRIVHDLSGLKIQFRKFRITDFTKEKLVRELEAEKRKLSAQLKKLEWFGSPDTPSIEQIQMRIETGIRADTRLPEDRKDQIITSIKKARDIIMKLKQRSDVKSPRAPG